MTSRCCPFACLMPEQESSRVSMLSCLSPDITHCLVTGKQCMSKSAAYRAVQSITEGLVAQQCRW